MKITFAMITFNTDFVLEQAIESILPYGDVVIAEGPVGYWADKGYITSSDRTNRILNKFKGKIKVVHGQWKEKTEMCQAFMKLVDPMTDYLWCIDSDEIFKPSDIEKTIEMLRQREPSSVGFRSNTFFGGLSHIMLGFERRHSFKRILRFTYGCTYFNHRPPTLDPVAEGEFIIGEQMAREYGVEMFHYSYCSPSQVKAKVAYYEAAVIAKGQCIPDYFNKVWLPWVRALRAGNEDMRMDIERKYHGVHEFVYGARNTAYTERFHGRHPQIIVETYTKLMEEFDKQLKLCL